MNIFIYFGGTGEDYRNQPEEEANRYLEYYEPRVDRLIFVDGNEPHVALGIFTKAYSWLQSNFVNPIFIVKAGNVPRGCYLFSVSHSNKVRPINDISSFWTSPPEPPETQHKLFLAGFSRGSVMTFLLARIFNERNLSRYDIHIAALEPVPGNLTQYNLGDKTMYSQVKSLGNIPQIKRCVVALGSYSNVAGFASLDAVLGWASQMCPEPIGTNEPPYIRPFIFNKESHLVYTNSLKEKGYLCKTPEHIAFFYAGFPVINPYSNMDYYISHHRYQKKD